MLKRAIRNTLILGVLASVVLTVWPAGWRERARCLHRARSISAASIFEWRRLVRLINARMDGSRQPRGCGLSIAFFLLRLAIFGGVIYGSLKCFQGSAMALRLRPGPGGHYAHAGKRFGCCATDIDPCLAAG